MGTVYVDLAPTGDGFQAAFSSFFKPDAQAFKARRKSTCCAEIRYIQIGRVKVNGSTIGKGADWGLWPNNPPLNKWFVDSKNPPYYSPTEGVSNFDRAPYPSITDRPGPTLGFWKLQDLSFEFEDAVVCSKSAAKGGTNKKGVGDVFGAFQWGFSYYVKGPAWNRNPVARKMYINRLVWTDAESKKVNVVGISGKEQIEIGGPSLRGFKGFISLQEPSEEMKKVLSQYFPSPKR
jgi:hypothetical protein